MVPWHPPCALISLIFSSLDPETNCCYFEVVLVGRFLFRCHYSVLQLAFILNHFLCSCQGAAGSPLFCLSAREFPFSVRFANPESDTDSNAFLQQLPMRRCASTDLPRGNSACSATLLPCFIHPLGGSYGRLTRVCVSSYRP